MTSSIDDPSVTEITALLQDNAIIPTTTTASPVIHEEWKPTWYWPWKPSYWPAIVLVFLLNLTAGSIAALSTIFLRELFCERGIPKLFPIFGDSKDGSIINPDDPNCESAEYSIAIAKFVGVSVTMAAILVTLTLRYWSALSDRIGRKRTILICNLGVAVSCAIQVYVRVNSEVNVLWLLFAVVIESLTGAGALLDALIHAYCSDLTLPEERIVVFGRIFAGSYAGLAAGSAIGGIAAEKFGLDFVFIWLAPSLLFLLCLYSMIMPESLTAATMSKNRENYKKSAVILVDETEQPDPKKQEKRSLKEHITSFINGFMPDKLPNRLAGKYSIPILMLSGTIATGAIIGNPPFSFRYFLSHTSATAD
ncbi:hypothetical protein BGZ46_000336 [Entomortierella lignicola]|nr:hypothetical protein BGZ46_000336 [Entomortierella lignicola]